MATGKNTNCFPVPIDTFAEVVNRWSVIQGAHTVLADSTKSEIVITVFEHDHSPHFYIYWMDSDNVLFFISASKMYKSTEAVNARTFRIPTHVMPYIQFLLKSASPQRCPLEITVHPAESGDMGSWSITSDSGTFTFTGGDVKEEVPMCLIQDLSTEYFSCKNTVDVFTYILENKELLLQQTVLTQVTIHTNNGNTHFIKLRFYSEESVNSSYIELDMMRRSTTSAHTTKSVFSAMFSTSKWIDACSYFYERQYPYIVVVSYNQELFELRCLQGTHHAVMLASIIQ